MMILMKVGVTLLIIALCFSQASGQSSIAPKSKREKSHNWPIFRGDANLRGYSPHSLKLPLKIKWTFKANDAIHSSPIIVDGVVYVGSDDKHLYALNAANGEKLWSYTSDGLIESPPFWYRGRIYFGSSEGSFYSLDANSGKKVWEFKAEDKFVGSANASGNHILVGNYDSHLYALNAKSGKLHWKYKSENFINGTPAVSSKHISFGGCDSKLHVLSLDGKNKATVEVRGQIAASPVMTDDYAYVGHYGNKFVAIDLAEQNIIWTYKKKNFPFFSSAATVERWIVMGGRDKYVHCLDRFSGKARWTFKTRGKVDADVLICGDQVIAASLDSHLYILSLETGELQWKFPVGPQMSSPSVSGGRLYVASDDGSLLCFGPREP